MTIAKVFKSTLSSCTYVFKDGISIAFIGGKCAIDIPKYAEELALEVCGQDERNFQNCVGQHKSKHPFIYVDANEQEIDSEALSPLEELRAQIREEEAAKLQAAMNLAPSSSKTDGFAASISNSTNNALTGDSNSGNTPSASELIANARAVTAAAKK